MVIHVLASFASMVLVTSPSPTLSFRAAAVPRSGQHPYWHRVYPHQSPPAPGLPTRRSKLAPSSPFRSQHQATTESYSDSIWKPTIQELAERKKFFREQQSSFPTESLGTLGFHHIEFYTGDALTTAKRFELALGIPITCWSSLATGNDVCVTFGLECGVDYHSRREDTIGEGVRFLITAPYSRALQKNRECNKNDIKIGNVQTSGSNVQMTAPLPLPGYDVHKAHEFYSKHGLAVRAVGIQVQNADTAYENAIKNGAKGVLAPAFIPSFHDAGHGKAKECRMAEIELYGEVVLRLISYRGSGDENEQTEASACQSDLDKQPIPILPNLAPYPKYSTASNKKKSYGLSRIDHAVGNVPNLLSTQNYIQSFTNYHPFAEFTPDDVGTVDSGLNSVVLASDNEAVLLPLNEPTTGKRKSQIQTFLEQNEGPGLQHIAIKTNDIFETIAKMRYAEENLGGFELMVRPSDEYYQDLPSRLGNRLTKYQYEKLEELGILADADDEGVLLQIFTKPLGDRPTLFIEVIQRIGCILRDENEGKDNHALRESFGSSRKVKERPGCGGFGQGNFRELFKAIEDHEKTLKV